MAAGLRRVHSLRLLVLAPALVLMLALALAAAAGAPLPDPSAPPTPGPAPTVAPAVLLDETFGRAWPSDPEGPAWLAADGYRLFARRPGQFVAIRAPLATASVPADLVVSGTFEKVGGPPGGGYGLIVRDQARSAGDGVDQSGQFVVAEVGDRGEVGVWQRDDRRWIDLLPWTASPAVHPGQASNALTLEAQGDQLRLVVNGTQVAAVPLALATGGVGVFVGGDQNQVRLQRFTLQVPPHGEAAPAASESEAISQAHSQLTQLSGQAQADAHVVSDPAWQNQLSQPLAILHQLERTAAVAGGDGPDAAEAQRIQGELAGVSSDLSALLGAFAGGANDPHSPLNDPAALRQASAHLNSASQHAGAVLDELQRLQDGQ